MKSALRRLSAQAGPPVPMAGRTQRSHIFNLGGGKADRDTYLRTYGTSGTVFSIVSLLAQSAATPEWHLYKKAPRDGRVRYTTTDQGSDQRTEVVQHAALQLLNRPNDFHSRFEFFEATGQHLELTGETFWVLSREATTFPTAMWYVRPDRMEPVPSPDDYLVGWIYTGPNGEQVPLKLTEVIQEKLPDPTDPFRGSGPVASILPNIQQQRYATEYQRNLFIAGADPGGIITVPTKLSEREFDELVDRWREAHQGVARAGRVGVLENGAQWMPGGQTNKDMDYANLRLNNRDEIREAWRMHKALLGTVEDVNRANAQTAEEVFVSWSVLPRLNRRRDTLNSKLLPMFGTSGEGVEFDFEDPSPVNQEAANSELLAKAQAVLALKQAGYDEHDILEVVGLPDMDLAGGNEIVAQPATDNSFIGDRSKITIYGKRDAAGKVFEQEAQDYPASAMAWMHHARWSGPVDVPLTHINPTLDAMDGADPDHVQQFVQLLENGKKVKPLVLVKTPGSNKLKLVDGHHRFLAYAQLQLPVRAYIGVVDADHGPWESMHEKQKRRGPGRFGGGDVSNYDMGAALRRVLADGYVPVESVRLR